MAKHDISIKRVYEGYKRGDGFRILVDRLWPRGESKEKAHIDLWLKEVAPSTELRKWFGHDPKKWSEFKKKYHAELKDKKDLIKQIIDESRKRHVTLIYGAKDEEHNQAIALLEYLNKH
jgi:uncharacterized protein YeaO (DUF488 family)